MNREETREAAEVMLHFASGGVVEMKEQGACDKSWIQDSWPVWNFEFCVYRKAPPKPVKKYVGLYRSGDAIWCGQPKSREGLVFRHANLFQIIEVEEPA